MVDQNDSDNRINEPHATMEKTDLTETSWEDMLGSGSILRKVVKEGNPNTKPTRSQICEINYQYELEDGTLIIKEDGFLLQLGDCEVRSSSPSFTSIIQCCVPFEGYSRFGFSYRIDECWRHMGIKNCASTSVWRKGLGTQYTE